MTTHDEIISLVQEMPDDLQDILAIIVAINNKVPSEGAAILFKRGFSARRVATLFDVTLRTAQRWKRAGK